MVAYNSARLNLTGCAQKPDYESVMDTVVTFAPAQKKDVIINLPENAVQEVLSSLENGSMYLCENYTVTVQTVNSGDLKSTFEQLTGYSPEYLPIIETIQGDCKRYTTVWSATGETGDQVGRCVVLDDGNYHYTIAVMADAEDAGQLIQGQWETVLNSFRLVGSEEITDSGS